MDAAKDLAVAVSHVEQFDREIRDLLDLDCLCFGVGYGLERVAGGHAGDSLPRWIENRIGSGHPEDLARASDPVRSHTLTTGTTARKLAVASPPQFATDALG